MARIDTILAPALDVADLRLALALAQTGTTARAASVLHLSQSAVSRALLTVEDKLGARLFDRTPRGLVTTAAGARLVAGATRVLGALGELEHDVRAPAAQPVRLRVVCQCYTAYHWLPTVLAGLRRCQPALDIELAVEHTQAPLEALRDGAIDAALLTTLAVPRGALEERPLFSDEIVFVVAADHPLAARKALTRADLREHTLITAPSPPAETQRFLTHVFGRARPRLRYHRLPLTEAILDVTRAGMGVAILSEWIASPHLRSGELVARRPSAGPLHRPWRLAWRREVRDAALRLHAALTGLAPRAQLVAR